MAQVAGLGDIRVHCDGCLRDGGERAAVELTNLGVFERQNGVHAVVETLQHQI